MSLSFLQAQQPKVQCKARSSIRARAPIAGARIVATPEGRTSGFSAVSGPTGEFSLSLEAGKYQLTVSADGFKDTSQPVTVAERGKRTDRDSAAGVRAAHDSYRDGSCRIPSDRDEYRDQDSHTALIDIPQSITIVSRELIKDQLMMSMADVVRYVPGITMAQGEGHRDAPVIRGNSTTSDFYVNGVRDDVQYFRDLYNMERVEAIKGPNAMIFGRGGGGGVINRVTKEAGFTPLREISLQGGSFGNKRFATRSRSAAGR